MKRRTQEAARARLRQLLARRQQQPALTERTVDELTHAAVIDRWNADDEIVGVEDAHDLAPYCLAGFVKVLCPGQGRPVTVAFVPEGAFVPSGWLYDAGTVQRWFTAVAHTDGVVIASWSRAVLLSVLSALPPALATNVQAHAWRCFSTLARRQAQLRGLALRERLLLQLRHLAADVGEPHASGRLVRAPLTHDDLAGLAVASRARVSRAMAELAEDGLVVPERRGIYVVTQRALVPIPTGAPLERRSA